MIAGSSRTAVVLVASLGTFGADAAGAGTTTPDFVLTSDTMPRGGSTTFTSTFTMDEGTVQATLNNLGAELTRTFDAGCTATSGTAGTGPFTCTVSGTGAIAVGGGSVGVGDLPPVDRWIASPRARMPPAE